MSRATPIAIVGIGCRFPGGASGPDGYWRLLRECGDAVAEVPADRWSSDFLDPDVRTPGTAYARRGGFLPDPGKAFDAAFFGISPREAETLDPQQRLLLEVGYEALEDAGIPLESVRGTRAGVFVGGFTLDNLLLRFADLNAVDAHTATSSSMTVLSNRLSYTFDLRGPSVTIDTACSSSLVATHLACRALRDGDCDLALVGGVNVMLLPNFTVVMCKGRFLAPDGRSKAFDAAADGYGRGEGAGMVVLKSLDRALADGDRIYAVLRGTGVNQDGATDGMPQPSGEAQATLFRAVCDEAGVDPAAIGYVEAHGTGTALGDPIEVGALGSVYGRPGDPSAPRLGSVKPNIGHQEAAAGVAGLIKAALAVHHAEIPPQWRPTRVNPALRLDEAGLRLTHAVEPWSSERRLAAVNSFGYGGTNAHAVLEQAPPSAPRSGGRVRALPLGAVGEDGLRAAAGQLAAHLRGGASFEAVAGASAHHRSRLQSRAVVLAETADLAIDGLSALAEGRAHPSVVGPAAACAGFAWLYTGMGPQWWAMGAELARVDPAFRAGLDRACDALAAAGLDLRPDLFLERDSSRMARNDVAQPANFALQVGLTEALRARGLQPSLIVGHSTGEMAAAWAAGALTLADAAKVVAVRARLQQECAGGGMLAVALGEAGVRPLLDRIGGLEIAAYNADDAVTVAGPIPALEALAASLEADGTWCARVRVQVAYHSAAMDPVRERMLAALAGLAPVAPSVPLISTVTGAPVTAATHDAAYWWANTRGAVRLADALRAAFAAGVDAVVEVGPHPVLAPSVVAVGGPDVTALHALRRQEPELAGVERLVAACYVRGAAVDPKAFAEPARAELPRYPWQRRVLWREPAALAEQRLGRPGAHPLLRRSEERGGSTRLDRGALGWLRDHVVRGAPILPGAAFVEAARAAAAEGADEPVVVLGDLVLDRALSLEAPGTAMWLRAERRDGQVIVESRTGDGDWVRHATARIEEPRRWKALGTIDLDEARARTPEEVDVAGLYAELARRGLQYGPAFRGLRRLWRGPGEVFAELDPAVAPGVGFVLHPALLDAAFQALLAATGDGRTLLPVGLERLQVGAEAPAELRVSARIRHDDGRELVGDLWLTDETGEVAARFVGLRCRALAAEGASDRWWHDTAWTDAEHGAPRAASWRIEGHEALAAAMPAGHGPARRVWVAPEAADPVGGDLLERLMDRIRDCVRTGEGLDVCTRGALAVEGSGGDPAHAALWGLARVARTEHPVLGLRLFDLDPRGEDVQAVIAALTTTDDEEVALRGGRALAARMERVPPEAGTDPAAREVPAGSVAARLVVAEPGRLDSLVFVPAPRPAPGPGEVEIEVEAAPLNFKDVMKALGLLDEVALESSYLGTDLGMEAVGRIRRAGEGVSLREGQRVLVYRGGTMRTHVVADARFVVPCPEGWDAEQAASFFVTATAWHALVDVARVRAGETVLVQSAAGGVGLAAVHVARRFGARVLATAGTEDKRAFLRALGVEAVFDSRTLDFGDEVRASTGGRGVDLVLNSLGGRAIDVGLDCLAPGGRFVELGKRDLAEGRALSLRAFNRRISLMAVDLDRAATEDPGYFPPLAATVADELASGRLPTLPAESWPADGVVDAFRALASGGRIGKVSVRLRDGRMRLAEGMVQDFAAEAGRSWLVTGGLSGFGLATADWLADHGVTHLVLASRRGRASGSEALRIAQLRDRGVDVAEVVLDCADGEAVHRLVAGLQASGAPLGGVVHAAALLDDAPLDVLTVDALRRVVDAKARGAWHLHRATEGLSLQSFVLYGSISAQVGNPGQAAYAAANLSLEGLAALRRSRGLPATVVAWGVLDEVGMVARDAATGAHLRSVGLTPMPPVAALDALGRALAEGRARVGLVDIDWNTWSRAHGEVSWRRLERVREHEESGAVGLAAELAALPEAERLDRALEVLVGAAAPVFGLPVDELDPARPLRDLGLDSLMAVELAGALGRATGAQLSAMELLGGRSLRGLAVHLVGASAPPAVVPAPAGAPAPADPEAFAASVRERILLTAPYDRLEQVRIDGEWVSAEVRPDVLPMDLGPIAAAEAGRHLAILGSFAAVLRNPQPGRHEYAVATADLRLDAVEGDPAPRVTLRARCTGFDRSAARATAEGELFDAEGRRLATLTVGYHVLPVETLRALFPERVRPAEATGADPYASWSPAPVVRVDGERVTTGLPSVPASACAGHFPGLPALPVSILGRHVFHAVAEAMRHASGDPESQPVVRRAVLETRAWVWAGEPVSFVATPDGSCEVRSGGQTAATFRLECAPMRARAHHRASRAA